MYSVCWFSNLFFCKFNSKTGKYRQLDLPMLKSILCSILVYLQMIDILQWMQLQYKQNKLSFDRSRAQSEEVSLDFNFMTKMFEFITQNYPRRTLLNDVHFFFLHETNYFKYIHLNAICNAREHNNQQNHKRIEVFRMSTDPVVSNFWLACYQRKIKTIAICIKE